MMTRDQGVSELGVVIQSEIFSDIRTTNCLLDMGKMITVSIM
jgi:hypothetical protein